MNIFEELERGKVEAKSSEVAEAAQREAQVTSQRRKRESYDLSSEIGYTVGSFSQTHEDIQLQNNWIQSTARGGGAFPAMQHGEPQIHQALQTAQHAEPSHHQQVLPNQPTKETSQMRDIKKAQLPLSRVKKIMRADEDVKMVAADAPAVLVEACELFILDLTHRSWIHTEESGRRTLQRNDIAVAITRSAAFDFLDDVVPIDQRR